MLSGRSQCRGEIVVKYLIPIDGSELSVRAVRYALRLATQGLRIELVLANVQEPPSTYELITLHDRQKLDELAQAAGQDMLASAVQLAQAAGVPFVATVVVGDVVALLLELCESQQCEAVLMASHGQGAVPGVWLGSTSLAMLKASSVPVTFVKPLPEPDSL